MPVTGTVSILMASLGREDGCMLFIDEDGLQRGEVTCSGSHSLQASRISQTDLLSQQQMLDGQLCAP